MKALFATIILNFIFSPIVMAQGNKQVPAPQQKPVVSNPNAIPALVNKPSTPAPQKPNAPQPNLPPKADTGSAPIAPPTPVSPDEIPLTSQGLGRRDPFTLPLYIINKIQAQNAPPPGSRVDDSVEPIRRWPLVSYTLVGIIWDVKNAKALIRDQQQRMHILKIRDRIGYDNGVITDIREGSVTVLENQIPQVLRLKK